MTDENGSGPGDVSGANVHNAAASADALDHRHVIAIDGPGGAGKTTVAIRLADRLGAVFLDTGLLYRAATVLANRHQLTAADGPAIARLIEQGAIQQIRASVADGRPSDLLVEGRDVTPELRSPEIDRQVSAISAAPAVRSALLPLQRQNASGKVVMVGRDITTIVAPDAGVKIYLNASAEERARRRWREMHDRGPSPDYDSVLADLRRRDGIDRSRDAAPLTISPDATIVETDGKSIDEVVTEIVELVERTWAT